MIKKLYTYLCMIVCIFITTTIHTSHKALIMTYAHSRPDFIELHAKTFKAFLKDPYEYVVFNDAPNAAMSEQIEKTCQNLNIRCFRVPNHHPHRQTPNYRHMDGIKYSLELLGFNHNGIVVMIDADMFLTKPFSIEEYMSNYDFIGAYQSRENNAIKVVYSGPFLVFMNMEKLPNKKTISFEGDRIEGVSCDVGGHTHYYFKNNPIVNIKYYEAISTTWLPKNNIKLQQLGYDENTIKFILSLENPYTVEFHADTYFVHHYAGGSNWVGYSKEYLQHKSFLLNTYLDQQIKIYQ